jgi:hypothetical protein
MMQLSLAYLFAGGLITVLVLLARRNRKQGWHRQRGVWLDVQSAAALKALEVPENAPGPDAPLQHLGDLGRLQQSLTADSKPKEQEKKVKMLA